MMREILINLLEALVRRLERPSPYAVMAQRNAR
jgi:hypothetical protein